MIAEKKLDPTLNELREIFKQHGLEFYIKKQKGSVIKVHFMIKEEEENT